MWAIFIVIFIEGFCIVNENLSSKMNMGNFLHHPDPKDLNVKTRKS